MATISVLTERLCRGYGVDLVVDRWSRALAERSHDVTVFANLVDGLDNLDTPYAVTETGPLHHPALPLRELRPARLLLPTAARNSDLIIAHTPPYFRLAPSTRRPFICIDYGTPPSDGFPPAIRANFAYRRLAERAMWFRAATRVVAISSFLADQLPRAVQPRVSTVHLGADHLPASSTSRAAVRADWGVRDDEVVAIYVGRFGHDAQPYKGTRDLVPIVADAAHTAAHEIRLVVVGTGTDRDAEELIAAGAIVERSIEAARLAACYAAADVYLTATRWEGFDLPAVEAQHAGLPVVALDVGAHGEVISAGKSGLLANNISELADKLAWLARSPEQRRAMGREARMWVEQFHWDRSGELFCAAVEQVLAGAQ